MSVAIEAVRAFFKDQPFQLAAALSYYTLLSIAPLLLVVTGVAGLLLGDVAVREALLSQAGALVGEDGASLMRTVLENANEPEQGLISVIVGFALVLIGASTVFAQLQVALNRIWHVEAVPSNAVLGFLRHRLISLSVVFGIGFLLWVSLIVSAVLNGIHDMLDAYIPGMAMVWSSLNIAVSLGLFTVLLALLFKYVPDAKIAWRDTWAGAAVTAVLFTVGKYAIGLYLGQASVGSAYGAAGSAVVLMVWVYYASLILFLGAEITQVLARQRGRPLAPSRHAQAVGEVPDPQV
jgi:membrane protein